MVIVEWEGDLPGVGKFRFLELLMLVGKVGWVVTCGTKPEKFNNFEDDFHAIVRSLRILK